MKERVAAPVPIMSVLDAVLAAMGADDRFYSCPSGNVEIAWRQPSKGRNGEGDRPARYCVTIEFLFRDEKAGGTPETAEPSTPESASDSDSKRLAGGTPPPGEGDAGGRGFPASSGAAPTQTTEEKR